MDSPAVEIRSFQTADLDDLQAIRARAFAPIFRALREAVDPAIAQVAFAAAEKEQAELLAGSCDPGPSRQVFVALIDGHIVGFVCVSLDHDTKVGEISLNAVDPDFAGRGIGTQLYDHALGHMKAAGMQVATVGVGGDASDAPARRAYEKAGFGQPLTSLWLYRTL